MLTDETRDSFLKTSDNSAKWITPAPLPDIRPEIDGYEIMSKLWERRNGRGLAGGATFHPAARWRKW